MTSGLARRPIAFLATDGVDQRELAEPWTALADAGADLHLVSLRGGEIQSTAADDVAGRFPVDRLLSEVRAGQYDALVLPGGAGNLDRLRTERATVGFVKAFMDADKPVAAIGGAAAILLAADALRGRSVTSAPDLAAGVRAAGAEWVDRPVVVDQKLITGRGGEDLAVFCARLVALFGDAIEERRLDFTVEQSFPASDPPPGPTAG